MATYVKKMSRKFYTLFASLCFLFEIQSSFLNIEELKKSKYGVEISAEPVLLSNQENDGNTMRITSKHGQQYQCVLPIVHFEKKDSNAINVTTEQINSILEPLNDTCLYLLNGWWSYRVCVGKSVYQYHDEGHQVKDNISLGYFSGETDWSNITIKRETRGDKRYHSQFYDNGSVCDLTGEPRKTEVRFFCNLQGADHISRIDESSTCVYIMSLQTNKLCNHSLFQPPPMPQKHSITCSPALMDDQYKQYIEEQDRKSEETMKDGWSVSESDNEVKDEDKQKEGSRDIFDTLVKMYHEANIKHSQHGPQLKTKEAKVVDWSDFFKKTKSFIDKSMQKISKLQREKESLHDKDDEEDLEDENDDDTANEDGIDEESESSETYQKTRKLLKGKKTKRNIDEIEDGDEAVDGQNDMGWDVDTMDEVEEDMDIEGSSTLFKRETSKFFDKIKKQEKDEKSEYYQQLIERLKMQYQFFKKQLNTVTTGMNKKIQGLEAATAGSKNPNAKVLIDTIKLAVQRLEDKQNVADDAMKRLSDLYDAVTEDPDYLNANEELASIRSTLTGLVNKVTKADSSEEDTFDASRRQRYKRPISTVERLNHDKARKAGGVDMETPKLDKIVSKLKKIMTHDYGEEMDKDEFEDDRISVRVTKIKEKSEDIYDDDKSYMNEEDDKELDKINENEEMREATKKMESMVRKQLEDAGVKSEGKIKVKIVTSKEALQRVANGHQKFQILTPQDTNQFRDLLSNLLGGTQELMKEKRRQEEMEDNYNLVWKKNGFSSADVNKEQISMEHEDTDENR